MFANWLIRCMLHADLKLENILFTKSDDLDVKLADFGHAVEGSRAIGIAGTDPYMAPEISLSLSEGYTAAVDYWSLGIVLYVMMVGKLPYGELEDFARDTSSAVELFGCVIARVEYVFASHSTTKIIVLGYVDICRSRKHIMTLLTYIYVCVCIMPCADPTNAHDYPREPRT